MPYLAVAALAPLVTTPQIIDPKLENEVILAGPLEAVPPSIVASPTTNEGLIVWGETVGSNCEWYLLRSSYWDGANWSAASATPTQMAVRHLRFGISWHPHLGSCLVTLGTSRLNALCHDDIAAFTWDGAWSAPTVISDGINDDDINGSVRFDMNGSYALAVWRDELNEPDNYDWDVAASVFDLTAGTWSARQYVADAPGVEHRLRVDQCLAQVPSTGDWLVVFQSDSGASRSFGFARFPASPAGIGAPTVEVRSGPTATELPSILASGSRVAAFWSHRAAGNDLELVASLWDDTTHSFGPLLQLTSNTVGDRFRTAVADVNGWHVLFTRRHLADPLERTPISISASRADDELYYAWFDGQALTHEARLTYDTVDQGVRFDDEDSGVAVARMADGSIHLVWHQSDQSPGATGSGANDVTVRTAVLR